MKKSYNIGLLFFFICLALRLDALSLFAHARLLAGMEAHSIDRGALSIEKTGEWSFAAQGKSSFYYWNREEYEGRANQLNKEMYKRREATSFFSKNLSEAYYNTKNVLYLFGGPDFCYPDLFFPEMENLILVGREDIGPLLDVEDLLRQKKLGIVIESIGGTLSQIPFRSYFVTESMKKEFYASNYGVSTLLLVSVVLSGYEIISYREMFLDQKGFIKPGRDSLSPCGIEIIYKKDFFDQERRIYYFSFDLMRKIPLGFLAFIHDLTIDTSFYKASSFITQNPVAAEANKIALEESTYIVQGESGIPFAYFHDGDWDLHLFGVYARPYYSEQSISSDWGMQKDLASLYIKLIDRDAPKEIRQMTKSIWGQDRYEDGLRSGPIFSKSDWRGIFPIHFDYGGQLTEKKYKPYTTAVQYAVKK